MRRLGRLVPLVLLAAGCTAGSAAMRAPESDFVYPNSNVTPLGSSPVRGESSTISFLLPCGPDWDAATDDAKSRAGADLLIDVDYYQTITLWPILLPIYSCSVEAVGIPAEAEVGLQDLSARRRPHPAPVAPPEPEPVPAWTIEPEERAAPVRTRRPGEPGPDVEMAVVLPDEPPPTPTPVPTDQRPDPTPPVPPPAAAPRTRVQGKTYQGTLPCRGVDRHVTLKFDRHLGVIYGFESVDRCKNGKQAVKWRPASPIRVRADGRFEYRDTAGDYLTGQVLPDIEISGESSISPDPLRCEDGVFETCRYFRASPDEER